MGAQLCRVPRVGDRERQVTEPERLTRTEIAARFGVSERTITNWVKDGMPQRSRDGAVVYTWADCYKWREKRIRESVGDTRDGGGAKDLKREMAESKAGIARVAYELAALNLVERKGTLIPLAFMRSEFSRIGSALRAQLLSLPPSWAARLAPCTTPVDRQIMLQDLVNELMPTLRALVDGDGAAPDTPTLEDVGADETKAA